MRLGKRERAALAAANSRQRGEGPVVHIQNMWDKLARIDDRPSGYRRSNWAHKSKGQASPVRRIA